jgi:hypothetical protein
MKPSLIPGDTRFDDIRSHFLKFAGFWAGQILWVWVVGESPFPICVFCRADTDGRSALPVVILNSPAVSDRARGGDNPSFGTGLDVAGIIVFAIGLLWEALGDIQKVGASDWPRLGNLD